MTKKNALKRDCKKYTEHLEEVWGMGDGGVQLVLVLVLVAYAANSS